MTTLKLRTPTRPAPTSRYNDPKNWKLVDKERLLEIKPGDTVQTKDGDKYVVAWLSPPHKESSQGKVTVHDVRRTETRNVWYASVVGCEYQYAGDLP